MEALIEFCKNTIIIGGALLMFLAIVMVFYIFAILGKIKKMLNDAEYLYLSLINLSVGDIVNFVMQLLTNKQKNKRK